MRILMPYELYLQSIGASLLLLLFAFTLYCLCLF